MKHFIFCSEVRALVLLSSKLIVRVKLPLNCMCMEDVRKVMMMSYSY